MDQSLTGGYDAGQFWGPEKAPLPSGDPLRYGSEVSENACLCAGDRATRPDGRESPAGRVASSLDTLQTSRPFTGDRAGSPPSFEDEFADAEAVDRYLLWRQQVYHELVGRGEDAAAGRWAMCGDQMPLYCGAGHERWGAYRCELPFCPDCAHAAAKELGARWLQTALALPLPRGYRWVHVVLTLRAGSTQLQLPGIPLTHEARIESMKADYGRILKCWAKLRNRWKRRHKMCAGFASREIGEDNHVHLHVLAQLPFIPQKELAKEWHQITGDSFVVWIAECFDPKTKLTYSKASGHQKRRVLVAAVREACKYVTKLTARNPTELVTIYKATRGTPRGRPWGKLHGRLPKKEKRSVPCPVCGDTTWFTGDGLRWLEKAARAPPDLPQLTPNWECRKEKSRQLVLL